MNASELALKMLEWQELQLQADALAAEISAAVLEIGKTQTVGNVRASFSNGRTSYDYEAAARANLEGLSLSDAIFDYTKPGPVDWTALVKAYELDASAFVKSQTGPSVSLKMLA